KSDVQFPVGDAMHNVDQQWIATTMAVAYLAARLTQTGYIRAAEVLRCLSSHAAVCAFGIYELCQHPTKILLLRWHAEQHALGAHVAVESLHIGDSEAQLDLACWIFLGSRVQRKGGFARHELAPAG